MDQLLWGIRVLKLTYPVAKINEILVNIEAFLPKIISEDNIILQLGVNETNPNRAIYNKLTLVQKFENQMKSIFTMLLKESYHIQMKQ